MTATTVTPGPAHRDRRPARVHGPGDRSDPAGPAAPAGAVPVARPRPPAPDRWSVATPPGPGPAAWIGRLTVDGIEVGAGRLAVIRAPGTGARTVDELLDEHRLPLRLRVDGRRVVRSRDGDRRGVPAAATVGLVSAAAGSGTAPVADLVRDGRPATASQVIAALRAADLAELVDGLPAGIWNPVGPLVRPLSAVARVQLAIARVVLADPPVVVLDDPTGDGALCDADLATLRRPLRRVVAGRTALLISRDERLDPVTDQVVDVLHGHLRARPAHSATAGAAARYARFLAVLRPAPGV